MGSKCYHIYSWMVTVGTGGQRCASWFGSEVLHQLSQAQKVLLKLPTRSLSYKCYKAAWCTQGWHQAFVTPCDHLSQRLCPLWLPFAGVIHAQKAGLWYWCSHVHVTSISPSQHDPRLQAFSSKQQLAAPRAKPHTCWWGSTQQNLGISTSPPC